MQRKTAGMPISWESEEATLAPLRLRFLILVNVCGTGDGACDHFRCANPDLPLSLGESFDEDILVGYVGD